MIALKKILVPTDFGEAADAALTYAKALARNFGASIDVLHVAEDAAARMFAGEIYAGVPPTLQKDIEELARKELAKRLIDNDPNPLGDAAGRDDVERPGADHRELRKGNEHRSDRHGHAWPSGRWRTC